MRLMTGEVDVITRWRTAHFAAREARAKAAGGVACLTSEDGEKGVRAFREKRPPVWTGR